MIVSLSIDQQLKRHIYTNSSNSVGFKNIQNLLSVKFPSLSFIGSEASEFPKTKIEIW